MVPLHLPTRTRVILVAISTVALGVGAFVWLMNDLEGKTRRELPLTPSAEMQGINLANPDAAAPALKPTSDDLSKGTVVANGRTIPVELALDAASQERGLSYRDSLPDGEGMLFIFDRAERQTFWMHEMLFPLDMIFINGTRVVRVASDVPAPAPGEFPAIVSSGDPADKVLEINAGKAKAWGIAEGTEVEVER